LEINNKLKDKVILVTGGAGFIGSNTIDYLLKCGSIVHCLDDFSTGHKKNIENFLNNKNFKLFDGDICDINICQTAIKDVEYVLHLAARGSVPKSIEDPIKSNEINIKGFLNILMVSKNQNINKVVYASSSSVYGDSNLSPKIEDEIGNQLSPYAITKFTNELYAKNFYDLYGLNSIGIRYFNVFGPKQDPNGPYAAVIPKFISKLINYNSPIINGDGSISRDFTYIDNIVQLNTLAILCDNGIALNKVYNGAFGQTNTLNKLFELLRRSLSKFDDKILGIKPKYGPERKGDIINSLASIENAKKKLNYNPNIDFETGIKRTVNWYFYYK
tara:strand:+ start:1440 stop:2429 length:990 start_codon:yes stop_codon:yes gene_type:complete